MTYKQLSLFSRRKRLTDYLQRAFAAGKAALIAAVEYRYKLVDHLLHIAIVAVGVFLAYQFDRQAQEERVRQVTGLTRVQITNELRETLHRLRSAEDDLTSLLNRFLAMLRADRLGAAAFRLDFDMPHPSTASGAWLVLLGTDAAPYLPAPSVSGLSRVYSAGETYERVLGELFNDYYILRSDLRLGNKTLAEVHTTVRSIHAHLYDLRGRSNELQSAIGVWLAEEEIRRTPKKDLFARAQQMKLGVPKQLRLANDSGSIFRIDNIAQGRYCVNAVARADDGLDPMLYLYQEEGSPTSIDGTTETPMMFAGVGFDDNSGVGQNAHLCAVLNYGSIYYLEAKVHGDGPSGELTVSIRPAWRIEEHGDRVRYATVAASEIGAEVPELGIVCDRGARPLPRFQVQVTWRQDSNSLGAHPQEYEFSGAEAVQNLWAVGFDTTSLVGYTAFLFAESAMKHHSVTVRNFIADIEATFWLDGATTALAPLLTLCKEAAANSAQVDDETHRLGVMYALGQGVSRDDREAVKWFRVAAERGHAAARNSLGFMYEHGRGVPRDLHEAVNLYHRAAEAGDPNGQSSLGTMFASGRGVPQNDTEAVKWFRLAAIQGSSDGERNLAVMYANGRGVPLDERKAAAWFRRAAEHGDAAAQRQLGILHADGRGVAQDDDEAAMWFRRAAGQGDVGAQDNLGTMYASGRGVPQNDAKAVQWFRRAAEQGDAGAQQNLALMYESGRGVTRNGEEAMRWLRRAADQGNAEAQNRLGAQYATGQSVPKDHLAAADWFRRAAKQGNANAQRNLGHMYAHGLGVTQDYEEAARWYLPAAESGNAEAQNELGTLYATGQGVVRDDGEAVQWYRRAAEQGHGSAQENLDAMYEADRGVPQHGAEAVR